MRTDTTFLKSLDLEDLSRRNLIDLISALIEALESSRNDLSESVRTEIEQKFEIAELRKTIKKMKESV